MPDFERPFTRSRRGSPWLDRHTFGGVTPRMPDELVRMVIIHLVPEGKGTLVALAQCNKAAHMLVMPHLYRTLHLNHYRMHKLLKSLISIGQAEESKRNSTAKKRKRTSTTPDHSLSDDNTASSASVGESSSSNATQSSPVNSTTGSTGTVSEPDSSSKEVTSGSQHSTQTNSRSLSEAMPRPATIFDSLNPTVHYKLALLRLTRVVHISGQLRSALLADLKAILGPPRYDLPLLFPSVKKLSLTTVPPCCHADLLYRFCNPDHLCIKLPQLAEQLHWFPRCHMCTAHLHCNTQPPISCFHWYMSRLTDGWTVKSFTTHHRRPWRPRMALNYPADAQVRAFVPYPISQSLDNPFAETSWDDMAICSIEVIGTGNHPPFKKAIPGGRVQVQVSRCDDPESTLVWGNNADAAPCVVCGEK